jgi:hypothetical protein
MTMTIQTIKLCLDAILAIPEKQWLVSMWEDTNIEVYEEGRALAEWVGEHSGGLFVLIEQYNLVNATCGGNTPGHWDCWHYDPNYALYLVPIKVWQACSADVLGIHAEHQHTYSQCKVDPNIDYEAEERERRRRD